jgi:transposase
MEAIYDSVCGLDVHSASVQACVRWRTQGGGINQEVRSFGTMTRDLLALADWMKAKAVTQVAMESTGVYWKPIYNILEGHFTVLLVNARHVKHVPGRKTDVKDCQWLAQLLQCGLLKASFVPERPQRDLRDLTRHRSQLVAEQGAVVNRIHKTLEDANIKLGLVASDILGVSGRDMLHALIAGTQSPDQIAELARRKLRSKIPALRVALQGHLTDHHRFILSELMDQLEDLERRIERFSQRIEKISGPFETALQIIVTVPGFERCAAGNLIAEIGADMSRFPTAGHLASWAGVCPGSHESAGKRKSGKTTHGSRWLKATLVQAAWSATRKKNSYYGAQYRRLVGRRGKKRALVAVAHSLLVTIYHMLSRGCAYEELGDDYFDKRHCDSVVKHHVRMLERLGYTVTVTPSECAT